MQSDIDIARACQLKPVQAVATEAGIGEELLELYGRYKAKVDYLALKDRPMDGRLVLVTAINPTPAGEGKTTVSIGLADALRRAGKRTMLALREPSLGPVFGVKGGAAGGGYAQVVPMEDINLHFTGDLHAITAANNLLAAMVDNHIAQGNALGIDPRRITWKRCMDMNDRQLRQIVDGLGGRTNGMPREDGFDITTASEIMAVLCLASDIADLKQRLARIVVGRTYADAPVTAGQLRAQGAMAALLRDAMRPNLVQTLEGTPALVHGGPFANIAHGCNSIVATQTALRLADYVVTEAGFGADLGAEKFIDIKCRKAGLKPSCIVLVATVRALKSHGGVAKADLAQENLPALEKGLSNLTRHLHNIRTVWGVEPVVALNRFTSDTDAEIALVREAAARMGAQVALCEVWAKGGEGGLALAEQVVARCERADLSKFSLTYPDDLSLAGKIEAVAKKIYGAQDVSIAPAAAKQLKSFEEGGYGELPVCIAKTQYSFSDDPKKLGAPEGFTLTIRQARLSAGAGFVVALAGDIMTMPGLPRVPAAENIDVDDAGNITGLF
ncbi:MAG TPA: formate--tetrahydrofolate ligase [Candidatus Onthenecus intestinigallinarum]|uniref:Formate--tetrahydrofolate ligase n=1 Tax=Candidatus Onthenecus intestinigallinarum TaxID=2840875 RepID=A0A9D0ZBR5_9FIRM|nr:formate--tetrahydrofolate ligase [Candidatus Onthenecus intestinigallinarum]